MWRKAPVRVPCTDKVLLKAREGTDGEAGEVAGVGRAEARGEFVDGNREFF